MNKRKLIAERTKILHSVAPRQLQNMIGIGSGLGPLEVQVLRTMADQDEAVGVRQVCEQLGKEGLFVYSAVLNSMNRLVRKGILTRQKIDHIYHFRLAIDYEELAGHLLSDLMAQLGGNPERLVCRLLNVDPETCAPRVAAICQRNRKQSAH